MGWIQLERDGERTREEREQWRSGLASSLASPTAPWVFYLDPSPVHMGPDPSGSDSVKPVNGSG